MRRGLLCGYGAAAVVILLTGAAFACTVGWKGKFTIRVPLTGESKTAEGDADAAALNVLQYCAPDPLLEGNNKVLDTPPLPIPLDPSGNFVFEVTVQSSPNCLSGGTNYLAASSNYAISYKKVTWPSLVSSPEAVGNACMMNTSGTVKTTGPSNGTMTIGNVTGFGDGYGTGTYVIPKGVLDSGFYNICVSIDSTTAAATYGNQMQALLL